MIALRRIACLSALMLVFSTAAYAQGFHEGQEVMFKDPYSRHGDNWVRATITKNYGPNTKEQYLVKIDGTPGEEHARPDMLKLAAAEPERIQPPAFGNGVFQPGQKVLFKNQYSRFGDKWLSATITRDLGPTAVDRYLIKIDGHPGEEYARVPMLKPADAAQPDPVQNAPVQRPPVANDPAVAPPARPGHVGNPNIPNATPAALNNGVFVNGEPLGVPGKANYKVAKDGNKYLVKVAPPGEEVPWGRWNMWVGGQFSVINTENLGHGVERITSNYGFPEKANVVVINANGTWYKQWKGVKTSGNWLDLGQNVVQLIGYDRDDWTASVQNGKLQIFSHLAQLEEGKRF